MERVYCWRCKRSVPAFDEEEYARIERLYYDGIKAVKAYREKHGCALADTPIIELHKPLYDFHEDLTGETGIHHDEIAKHRLKDFGPPCVKCGKNLRTPVASKCFECGHMAGDLTSTMKPGLSRAD